MNMKDREKIKMNMRHLETKLGIRGSGERPRGEHEKK